MSEASTEHADRPVEVTDPLLWGLSAAVADAHQPDEDEVCVSPSCVGAAWPCAAWNKAQEGLRAARVPRPAPPTAEPGGVGPSSGRSTDPAPARPAEPLAVTAA
ncbi:hypothetical protein AB0F68_24755 [Micromonospora sp. NPDC023966]|uniref:hypothetical protein n=1 Tax=Micromonospora sp. NPDC023966 TaxID=3154699 RepID=UPI003408AD53